MSGKYYADGRESADSITRYECMIQTIYLYQHKMHFHRAIHGLPFKFESVWIPTS